MRRLRREVNRSSGQRGAWERSEEERPRSDHWGLRTISEPWLVPASREACPEGSRAVRDLNKTPLLARDPARKSSLWQQEVAVLFPRRLRALVKVYSVVQVGTHQFDLCFIGHWSNLIALYFRYNSFEVVAHLFHPACFKCYVFETEVCWWR